jgi:fluoroacetyl-CoA thioesterase
LKPGIIQDRQPVRGPAAVDADAEYDTAGTHVNVAHLAAAPLGSRVTIRVEVIAVDGRRLEFRVQAADGQETVGEGTHQRTIINVAKFAARQAAKK